MFRIKICGITNVRDALAATDAGADAIGLNFFNKSSRFVLPQVAAEIAASVPARVLKVGVFVNRAADDIAAILDRISLDCVQLHGDEPPSLIAELPHEVLVLRAHRCGPQGLASLAEHLEQCQIMGRLPDAVLIDADATTAYGGTGRLTDWSRVAADRALLNDTPLILAGGLTPQNVAAAIIAVRPDGVDVASGVEHEPGVKDHQLVAQFVAAASEALRR